VRGGGARVRYAAFMVFALAEANLHVGAESAIRSIITGEKTLQLNSEYAVHDHALRRGRGFQKARPWRISGRRSAACRSFFPRRAYAGFSYSLLYRPG